MIDAATDIRLGLLRWSGNAWFAHADLESSRRMQTVACVAGMPDAADNVDLVAATAVGASAPEHVFVRLDTNNCVSLAKVGLNITTNPPTDSLAVSAESVISIGDPAQYFAVKIDNEGEVISVTDGRTTLEYGAEFISVPGWLIFREHPSVVFEGRSVRAHVIVYRDIMAHTLDSKGERAARSSVWRNRYMKQTVDLFTLQRAAAESAGFYVTPSSDFLLWSTHAAGVSCYAFATAGLVTVDYPHHKLLPATAYPEGFIIGPDISLSLPSWTVTDVFVANTASVAKTNHAFVDVSGTPRYDVVDVCALFKSKTRAAWRTDAPVVYEVVGGHPRIGGWDAFMNAQIKREAMPTAMPLAGFWGTETSYIDFAGLLSSVYGSRLLYCSYGTMLPEMEKEFVRWIKHHRPLTSVLLMADMRDTLPT